MIYDADLSPWFYQLRGLQWFTMLTSVHDSINPWFTMIYNADLGPWFYQLNGWQNGLVSYVLLTLEPRLLQLLQLLQ